MGKEDLSRSPQKTRYIDDRRRIDHALWYYEEPQGLLIYHDSISEGYGCLIPLRQIRAYLKRLEAKD